MYSLVVQLFVLVVGCCCCLFGYIYEIPIYEIPIFQNWNKIGIKLEINLNKKLKFRNKIGIYTIPIQFQFFKKSFQFMKFQFYSNYNSNFIPIF